MERDPAPPDERRRPVAAFLAPVDLDGAPIDVADRPSLERLPVERWFGSLLPAVVRGWFDNGGGPCVIVPLGWGGRTDPTEPIGGTVGRGLATIDDRADVEIVAFPDASDVATRDGRVDLALLDHVHRAMISSCELVGGRLALIDPPPSLGVQQVREWRIDVTGYDTHAAAMYYPWIRVDDAGTLRTVPPCGHIAATLGRVDATRGEAPANMRLENVVDVELDVTASEVDLLHPVGVNVVRAFGRWGVRAWGARTLSSDPQRRDIATERILWWLVTRLDDATAGLTDELGDDPTPEAVERARRRLQVVVDGARDILARDGGDGTVGAQVAIARAADGSGEWRGQLWLPPLDD